MVTTQVHQENNDEKDTNNNRANSWGKLCSTI